MNVFEVAMAAMVEVLADLRKEDVPGVEAVINIVTPTMEQHWAQRVDEALDELQSRLAEIPTFSGVEEVAPLANSSIFGLDRKKITRDLVAALLLSLENVLYAPPGRGGLLTLREGAHALLREGGTSLGYQFSLAAPRSANFPLTATEDLLLSIRGRALTRRAELAQLIEEYLMTAAVRPSIHSIVADLGAAADGWLDRMRRLLGIDGRWIEPVVDAWAYRWFNVGAFSSARDVGVTEFVAWNPKDEKTTPFCWWVSGKVLGVERIERQLDRFTKAVQAGDIEGAMTAWPLATPNWEGGFLAYTKIAALPPYHFHCRTRVIPRRVA